MIATKSLLTLDYPKIDHSLAGRWRGFSDFLYKEDRSQTYQITSNVKAIFDVMGHTAPDIRYLFLPGGQDSCKTVGAMMWQIAALTSVKLNKKWGGPIMAFNCSQTGKKADETVFGIFRRILQSYGMWDDRGWLQGKLVYTFPNGAQSYFGGPDDFEKAKGNRFNIAYFDEMTSIDEEVFRQIVQRIFNKVMGSWNPDSAGWFEYNFLPELKNVPDPKLRAKLHYMVMRLNYLGNEKTDPGVFAYLEAMRTNNPTRYCVYGLGETGRVDQQVYGYWEEAELPENATLLCRGLDFGYNNNMALVDIYTYDQWYHVNQRLYEQHMSNPDVAEWIKDNCHRCDIIPIVCDAKNPDGIKTLRSYGLPAWPSTCQGNNQKIPSIEAIQSKLIRYTPGSIGIKKEADQYKFGTLPNGQVDYSRVKDKQQDHLLDAIRYAIFKYQKFAERPPIEMGSTLTTFNRETWLDEPEEQVLWRI